MTGKVLFVDLGGLYAFVLCGSLNLFSEGEKNLKNIKSIDNIISK